MFNLECLAEGCLRRINILCAPNVYNIHGDQTRQSNEAIIYVIPMVFQGFSITVRFPELRNRDQENVSRSIFPSIHRSLFSQWFSTYPMGTLSWAAGRRTVSFPGIHRAVDAKCCFPNGFRGILNNRKISWPVFFLGIAETLVFPMV